MRTATNSRLNASLRYVLCIFSVCFCTNALAQWSNELDVEYRYFFADPQFPEQSRHTKSIAWKPQWSKTSESGAHLFDFEALVRLDADDDERTHADINELSWVYTTGDWEFRSGIRKVFWGVTESQHLVDVINQTDAVERSDGEVKLGQPMLNVAWLSNFGTFDAYVLPYFRERTFPGLEGRLRTQPVVDVDNAVYESDDGESHMDFALRWKQSLGIWDIGLSYFDGTGRDPVFRSNNAIDERLVPNYVQIEQFGLDVQATLDAWLWKLEAISRDANERYSEQQFNAVAVGFEYTVFNLAESGVDVGLVAEYLHDSRGDEAFFNDYGFVGVRLALNDEQSTDLLIGCGADGTLCALEGSRRLTDSLSLALRANTFSGIDDASALASQRDDDNFQVDLTYYF